MEEYNISCGSIGNNAHLSSLIYNSFKNIDMSAILNYGDPTGLDELKEEIIKIYGLKINKDNLLITGSSQQALAVIIEYLMKERASMLVQQPAYFGLIRLLKGYIRGFESAEQLKNIFVGFKDTVIYVNSNFQNPSGSVMNDRDKRALIQIAAGREAMIIEDNPCDLLYYEAKPSRIFDLAPESTIYVSSFSKILAPGLRLGFIAAGKDHIKKMKSIKINHDLFTSTLNQQIAFHALRDGRQLEILREIFKEKRDLCLGLLDRYLKGRKDISWIRPEGGIFIEIRLPESVNYDEFIKLAGEKYKLTIDSDRYSNIAGHTRKTIRFNFVQYPREVNEEIITRLNSLLTQIGEKK